MDDNKIGVIMNNGIDPEFKKNAAKSLYFIFSVNIMIWILAIALPVLDYVALIFCGGASMISLLYAIFLFQVNKERNRLRYISWIIFISSVAYIAYSIYLFIGLASISISFNEDCNYIVLASMVVW